MYAMVCMDADYFLLLKKSLGYNKLHRHGKYVKLGCKEIGRFRELSDHREPLIHAFKAYSLQTIIPLLRMMHINPIEFPTCDGKQSEWPPTPSSTPFHNNCARQLRYLVSHRLSIKGLNYMPRGLKVSHLLIANMIPSST